MTDLNFYHSSIGSFLQWTLQQLHAIIHSQFVRNSATSGKIVLSGMEGVELMESRQSTELMGKKEETVVKKPLCIWSLVSLIISLAAVACYALILGSKLRSIIPIWKILSVVSILFPSLAKRIRLSHDQTGKSLETAAIIIGGFAFYSVIFLSTEISLYIGYLGWILGGILYKLIGKENK